MSDKPGLPNFKVGDAVTIKPIDPATGLADRTAEGYPAVVLEITNEGYFRVSHMYTGETALAQGGQLDLPA